MTNLFHFDSLSLVASILTLIIATIVAIYAKNYLRGDRNQPKFFINLSLVTLFMIGMASADNLLLMLALLTCSNLALVMMMIHKSSWKAAYNSGMMALKNFMIVFLCLGLVFIIANVQWQTSSIQELIQKDISGSSHFFMILVLVLIAAMAQSAIYPFSSWILSSLNSPTPVSGLMHAGLVNGGGIILTRFAPLILESPGFMTIIFVVGIISAVLAISWKLIQPNVKSMLACSTVSQMGFMVAQCGMGLFPAAIAHLFWHGMFKSYLFLSSANSWREKRLDFGKSPKISSFIIALIFGSLGAFIFSVTSRQNIYEFNTILVLVFMSFVAATQISLSILETDSKMRFIGAIFFSSLSSALYGFSIYLIEHILEPLAVFSPAKLNIFHIVAMLILFGMWMARVFAKESIKETQLASKIYVKLLNQSQPDSSTITSNRNNYNFR